MGQLQLESVGLSERKTVADIIFVHGLGGDCRTTWQVEGDASTFWPLWIFEDISEAKVWTLGYPADKTRWMPSGGEMALPDRAKAVLDLLTSHEIGARPLIFVAHSLGGLLVKKILRLAFEMGQPLWEALAANTRGVVFLATPHQGVPLASILEAIPLLRASVNATQLAADDVYLRDLTDWYQQNAVRRGIRTSAYFETMPLGPCLIVPQASANPGVQGCLPIPVDGHHLDICKPRSRLSPVYVGTCKFIKQIIQPDGDVTEDSDTTEIDTLAEDEAEYVSPLAQEYIFYTKKMDEDERLDLEEKLRRGGRDLDIPRAIFLKEQFAKQFTRNALQSSATSRYIRVLAEVESRFNDYVYPEIIAGASRSKVADLVRVASLSPPRLRAQCWRLE